MGSVGGGSGVGHSDGVGSGGGSGGGGGVINLATYDSLPTYLCVYIFFSSQKRRRTTKTYNNII